MQYTLMFYMGPDEFEARSHPEKQKAFWAAFLPHMKAIKEAGILVSGAGLQPPSDRLREANVFPTASFSGGRSRSTVCQINDGSTRSY